MNTSTSLHGLLPIDVLLQKLSWRESRRLGYLQPNNATDQTKSRATTTVRLLSPSPSQPPQATAHEPHPGSRTPSPPSNGDQSDHYSHETLADTAFSQPQQPWTCVHPSSFTCPHFLKLTDVAWSASTSATSPSSTLSNAGTARMAPVRCVCWESGRGFLWRGEVVLPIVSRLVWNTDMRVSLVGVGVVVVSGTWIWKRKGRRGRACWRSSRG
jgi:hypothetical protein